VAGFPLIADCRSCGEAMLAPEVIEHLDPKGLGVRRIHGKQDGRQQR